MLVNVKYRAQLAEITKTKVEQLEATIMKDVLRHIGKSYGKEAEKTAKSMLIAVNGESILHLKHFKTILHDGDEVSFLPICGGG